MKGTIGTGRRVTIPVEVFEQSGLQGTTEVDIQYKNGSFIVTPIKVIDTIFVSKNKNVKVKETAELKQKTMSMKKTKRKIVSNLEEGEKFSTKYYSECGLVIRTKNRYLRDFCSECRGQLVEENSEYKNRVCPYIKEQTVNNTTTEEKSVKMDSGTNLKQKKTHLEDIKRNIQRVNETIDKRVKQIKIQDATTLEPVNYGSKNYMSCTKCTTLHNKGFLVNGDFYCKDCAFEDFKMYLKNKKEVFKNV